VKTVTPEQKRLIAIYLRILLTDLQKQQAAKKN